MAPSSIAPCQTIYGVQFFSDRASCIKHFEEQGITKAALSCIKSYVTCLIYYVHKVYHILSSSSAMKPYTSIPEKDLSKKRLIVCIHGLANNPAQYAVLLRELNKQKDANTAIFIPAVKMHGTAPLNEMTEEIVAEIKKWAKANGDEKELVLIGTSNGGRIVRDIDTKLSDHPNIKKIRLFSIVGAWNGSSLSDLAFRLHIPWLMSKNIRNEMTTYSARTNQLKVDWNRKEHNKHAYTFIASPHDWLVPNYTSSLAEVGNHQKRYAIVPNHGHGSIVDAVSKTVATLVFN